MRRAMLGFIGMMALVLAFFVVSPALAMSDFTELAEKCGPAVVNINTVRTSANQGGDMRDMFRFNVPGMPESPFDDFFKQLEPFFKGQPGERSQRSLGSGFFISQDGFIVTNNHVIADATEVKVTYQTTGGKSETVTAEIKGRDKEYDLAVLKISPVKPVTPLAFGDSDALKVGQWVLAIGNPFGLEHTITAGIVSAKGRIIGLGPFDDLIQTDTSINPGNSGGPLLNMQGEVVGINTAIFSSGQGIGFAVPSNMAKKIINPLKEGKKVQRGWLGVTIQDVDQNTAKALGLPSASGALVGSVNAGQPADKAGVQVGDVITAVDGAPVASTSDLLKKVADIKPGQTASLSVFRKGRTETLKVVLGEREGHIEAEKDSAPSTQSAWLGLTLRPVKNKEEANELGLDDTSGLIVTGVSRGSVAAENDIRRFDVLIQANQKPLKNVDDLKKIVESEGRRKGVVMFLLKRQGQNIFRTVPISDK